MKNVMARAWEIRREVGLKMVTMGEALKRAWAEFKSPSKTLDEKIAEVIKVFYFEEHFSKKSYRQISKRWTQGGKDRLYIAYNAYTQAGYIDLVSMTVCGNKLDTLNRVLDMLK